MRSHSGPASPPAVQRIAGFVRRWWNPDVGIAAAVLLASMLIRLPFFHWPLTGDEGNYAYTAYRWSRGQPLYVDFFGLEKPQGLYLAYWASQILFGGTTWAIRLWGALWAGATGTVLYAFAKTMVSRAEALLAAVLFTLFASAPQIEGFTANAEVFMILPLALSAAMLWRKRFALAGFWISIALLLKLSALGGLALALFWLVYQRAAPKAWLRLAAGLALPLAAAFLHGALTSGAGAYLYNVVLFRIGVGWEYIASPVGSLFSRLPQTAPVWFPLGCFFLFGLPPLAKEQRAFFLAWVAASLLGVSMGGDWNLHYFVQLVPALSIPASIGLFFLLRAEKPVLRWSTAILIAVCAAWMLPPFLQSPGEGTRNLYHRIGIEYGEEIGAYLREHTEETDTVYVAFYQANIYYQSQREACVPFLSRVQLLFVPGAFDRLIDALKDRAPAYVVLLDQHLDDSGEQTRFLDALAAGYQPETTLEGVTLYRRIGSGAQSASP